METEDGWVGLGVVGQRLANIASDFDPRSYGFRKLSDLVRGTGAFEMDQPRWPRDAHPGQTGGRPPGRAPGRRRDRRVRWPTEPFRPLPAPPPRLQRCRPGAQGNINSNREDHSIDHSTRRAAPQPRP